MATVHVSEAEAIRDFKRLMDIVRAGNEVLIEREAATAVSMSSVVAASGKPISELIEQAEARERELGYMPSMEAEFAADLEKTIRNRRSRDLSEGE